MRDFLVFAIVFGTVPFILKRPAYGILAFTWISLMNPHRLTYGAAYDFPFAAMVGGITLLSLLFSKESKSLPLTPVTGTLLLFMLWTTITGFTALEPSLVWTEWNRVMKTLAMTILAMAILNTEKDIKAMAWVTGLSIGFYGLKGGMFTIASGGQSHVFGPTGSYITDNNALALALLMELPLVWYLLQQVTGKWLRYGLISLMLLTSAAIIGSYSRGALLGAAAVLLLLWWKSNHKFRLAAIFITVLLVAYSAVPDKWFDRMNTIGTYSGDASAMGRINAWHFAINVAKNHLLGGGFNVFSKGMFLVYAPDPLDHHAAHSIYFQVLGEHGFIGLILFLLLMLCAWRTGSRITKFCKDKHELKWAQQLAMMCQVSIAGYAIGGAFLSLVYYDMYYCIIALLVALEKIILRNKCVDQDASMSAARKGVFNVRGKAT